MKKTILAGHYQLRIFNDGTSGYIWILPWKIPQKVSSKDMILHSIWDKSTCPENNVTTKSDLNTSDETLSEESTKTESNPNK